MITIRFLIPNVRQLILAGMLALILSFITVPAMSADTIDPEADKILKSMSDYLSGLSAFSIEADVDSEIVDLAGQKLQLSSSATIIIERAGKIYMNRHGAYADVEIIFNGEVLTIHGKDKNVYLQTKSHGNVDNAFDILNYEIGLDTPGADLLLTNPYSYLSDGIMSSSYLGKSYVNGIECHYLTFREAQVDWQLWVQTGKTPLPMKYIITTKWVTGAPQYSIRFRDWNTKPQIEANSVCFYCLQGCHKT